MRRIPHRVTLEDAQFQWRWAADEPQRSEVCTEDERDRVGDGVLKVCPSGRTCCLCGDPIGQAEPQHQHRASHVELTFGADTQSRTGSKTTHRVHLPPCAPTI